MSEIESPQASADKLKEQPKEVKKEELAQLSLDLKIDDAGSFDSFAPGRNGPLIELLQTALREERNELFYIFGPEGCGKTHLLTALFRQTGRPASEIFFIDLKMARGLMPELLSIEVPPVLMLDNVDALAGDSAWELALFGLFNRWVDRHSGILLASATSTADCIPFVMPDLNTRFENGISLPLQPLTEEECMGALMQRASVRGFKIPQQVAAFLVRNLNRDMKKLTAVLNLLDTETLRARRKVTVPFVKEILANTPYAI